MPKLTIDGMDLEVAPGTSVLQACEQLGIEIPRFLLSRTPFGSGQLPHVPGRNAGIAQAHRQLRDAVRR